MRRILVCTGILGGGTALVFALAAATAVLAPQGTLVSAGPNGGVRAIDAPFVVGGANFAPAFPAPAPDTVVLR